jgi:hypothetical protein
LLLAERVMSGRAPRCAPPHPGRKGDEAQSPAVGAPAK